MESSRVATPFNGAAWMFALSTPGYRMLAEFGAGTGKGSSWRARAACLRSRRGVDAMRWFPEVARALHKDAPYVAGRSLAWLDIAVDAWTPALAA